MDIKLWSIYKLTTNSKTDIWTKKELRDKHMDPSLKNDDKYRYSVPMEKLRTINDIDIYLVFQINSSKPKKNHYFKIDNFMTLNDDQSANGYIMPINVRLALSSEFADEFTVNKGELGTVAEGARKPIYEACQVLMKETPRPKIIKGLEKGKYDSYTNDQLQKLIDKKQFGLPELHEKGYVSTKSYLKIEQKED